MNKTILVGIIITLVLLIGCVPAITDFESCASAGNPVMESYPRQCKANGQTFVEEISEPVKKGEQIIGGCGTVTPGLEDACCENVMKDAIRPTCIGEWKWNRNNLACEFECKKFGDRTGIGFLMCEEEGKRKWIQCEQDSDCSIERIKSMCTDIILPTCPTENFCVEGLCKFDCVSFEQ